MNDVNLYNLVEYLKTNRIIRRDVEIANKTGYSKQIVSNYINGKQKPSKQFIDKLIEVFQIENLDTLYLVHELKTKYIAEKPPNAEKILQTRIADLEARLKDKEEIIENKNEIINHLKDKIKRAEIIEKVFISALTKKTTLEQFHTLIESAVV